MVEARDKGGRPPHRPTRRARELVEILVAAGQSHAAIAAALAINGRTLTKHYADELRHGAARMTGRVIESLTRQALAGNASAARFLLANLLTPIPTPPPRPVPKAKPLGKKQKIEAEVEAGPSENSGWHRLLN